MKIKLPQKLTRFVGKTALKLKHASPEICVVTSLVMGGAAIVTTGIMTWRGKEKLQADAADIKKKKEELKALKNIDPLDDKNPMISKEEIDAQKKKVAAAYIDTGKDAIRTYWLPAALSAGSAGFAWVGRTLFRKEIGAMAALAAAATESYNQLYNKLKDNYGEEEAQKLAYGLKQIEVKDEETQETHQETVYDPNNGIISPYAFIFDEGEFDSANGEWVWRNGVWSNHKDQNIMNIQSIQRQFTDELWIRGWVTLGEVASNLGAKPNPAWNHVGWVWKEGADNSIEFRVQDGPHQLPFNRAFMDLTSPQNVCVIDPNVEGCIDYVFEHPEIYDKRHGKNSHYSSLKLRMAAGTYSNKEA